MRHLALLLALALTTTGKAQPQADYSKLSTHLAGIVQTATARQHTAGKPILALMKLATADDANAIARQHGCQVVDSVGRIYIVSIPRNRIGSLSLDGRVGRIEAERMPSPAMDVTPGQVNATPVYAGTGLPQAFTGRGVAAGVFDCHYDFTHPAFLDGNGQTRIKYLYDFLYPNDDGSFGRAWDSPDEILALEHPLYGNVSAHGSHVLGIMAGSAVDGKYQGMAPEADIYLANFNSDRSDFSNPDENTSAVAVLGFKYLFDQAARDGKPCVVNFSSCESIVLSKQRELESEALSLLMGPGRIIVAAAGNFGHQTSYMEKTADEQQAGTGIINGIGNGGIIDMDLITPVCQRVRFDFLGIKLLGGNIEGTITFSTDSVDALGGDTCRLDTRVSMGEVSLRIYPSTHQDPRGRVYHIRGDMPNMGYLLLCGALVLLSGDGPAWLYSDLFLSPFANVSGSPLYSHVSLGRSVAWPATMPGIISVGATAYKTSFRSLDGNTNSSMEMFAPDATGHIAKFSSLGPTFDGRTKPDVVAPGMSINAPFNSFVPMSDEVKKELTDRISYNGKDFYYMAQSGTSMASPVVAGAVALWLQAKPDLTPEQVLDVIAHTSTPPEPGIDYPNNTYGYGQIDVYAGLLYVLGLTDNPKTTSISRHQPQKAGFSLRGKLLTISFDTTGSAPAPGETAAGTPAPGSGATVTLYTTDGRQVVRTSLPDDASTFTIDLSPLPSGIYAVQLNTTRPATTGSTLIRL